MCYKESGLLGIPKVFFFNILFLWISVWGLVLLPHAKSRDHDCYLPHWGVVRLNSARHEVL